MSMNIYTPDGWLDAPHIDEIASRNNISFIIIIGKRQIGKTYNVLKLMLDDHRDFIFMRRVRTELDMLKKNVNSPFEGIHGYEGRVFFESEGEYSAAIYRLDTTEEGDKKTRIATGLSLSTVGNIRGFHSNASDLVFDEFIPEEHLFKVRDEDSAFLNAHVTISGNRELEGKPPLKCWLLANSNNLDSKILDALKITKDVERMSLRGEESRILKERGIMILLPESNVIIDKRKQTALYRAIGGDSKFSRMAFENEFAYNDYTDVGARPLAEYNPLVSIGRITIHLHKNDKTLYVTDRVKHKARYEYTDSDTHVNMFNRKFSDIRAAYLKGRITFMDMRVKNYFLNIVDM
jgi:hypothetical protein